MDITLIITELVRTNFYYFCNKLHIQITLWFFNFLFTFSSRTSLREKSWRFKCQLSFELGVDVSSICYLFTWSSVSAKITSSYRNFKDEVSDSFIWCTRTCCSLKSSAQIIFLKNKILLQQIQSTLSSSSQPKSYLVQNRYRLEKREKTSGLSMLETS